MLNAHVSPRRSAAGFYEKGSNVQDLKSKKEFRQRVLESDHLWAVEFYREVNIQPNLDFRNLVPLYARPLTMARPQGCGYCQLLTPEWEKVAENLKVVCHFPGQGACTQAQRGSFVGAQKSFLVSRLSGRLLSLSW